MGIRIGFNATPAALQAAAANVPKGIPVTVEQAIAQIDAGRVHGAEPMPGMEILDMSDYGGEGFAAFPRWYTEQIRRANRHPDDDSGGFLRGLARAVTEMKGGLTVAFGGPLLGAAGTAAFGAGAVEGAAAFTAPELLGAPVVTPVVGVGAPTVIGTATGGGAFVDAAGVALPASGTVAGGGGILAQALNYAKGAIAPAIASALRPSAAPAGSSSAGAVPASTSAGDADLSPLVFIAAILAAAMVLR